jgi:hypothetical protein
VGPAVRRARRLGSARRAGEGDRAEGKNGAESHAISVVPRAFFLTLSCNANPGAFFPLARTPVDCALRPRGAKAVKEIYKWMGIVVLIGFALMYVEYRFAAKKKEGFTPIDRRRIVGIFWLTLFFAALVGGVMWLSD